MRPQELRVNNYVNTPNGIKEIAGINYRVTKENELDYYVIFKDLHYAYFLIHEGKELIKPIHLTEERLIRLGFKEVEFKPYRGESYLIYRKEDYIVKLINNKFLFCLEDFDHQEMKYIHQLQNLFFDLTGKELTLKKKNKENER